MTPVQEFFANISEQIFDLPVNSFELDVTRKDRAEERPLPISLEVDASKQELVGREILTISGSSPLSKTRITVTNYDDELHVETSCNCQDHGVLSTLCESAGESGAVGCMHVWQTLRKVYASETFDLEELLPKRYTTLPEAFEETGEYQYSFVGPKIIRQLETWGDLGTNVYLVGPRGTGKTLLASEYGEKTGKQVFVITGSKGISDLDLLGRDKLETDPETGSTISKFIDGQLTQAFKAAQKGPVLLICDELSRIPVEHQNIFIKAFDTTRDKMCILENHITPHPEDKQIVVPKENLLAVATSNIGYAGMSSSEEALIDRFGAAINVGYLPRSQELSLLMEASREELPSQLVERILNFAEVTRNLALDGEIPDGLSTRALVNTVRYIQKAGIEPVNISDALESQLLKCLDLTSPETPELLFGLMDALAQTFPECKEYISNQADEENTTSIETDSASVLPGTPKSIGKTDPISVETLLQQYETIRITAGYSSTSESSRTTKL